MENRTLYLIVWIIFSLYCYKAEYQERETPSDKSFFSINDEMLHKISANRKEGSTKLHMSEFREPVLVRETRRLVVRHNNIKRKNNSNFDDNWSLNKRIYVDLNKINNRDLRKEKIRITDESSRNQLERDVFHVMKRRQRLISNVNEYHKFTQAFKKQQNDRNRFITFERETHNRNLHYKRETATEPRYRHVRNRVALEQQNTLNHRETLQNRDSLKKYIYEQRKVHRYQNKRKDTTLLRTQTRFQRKQNEDTLSNTFESQRAINQKQVDTRQREKRVNNLLEITSEDRQKLYERKLLNNNERFQDNAFSEIREDERKSVQASNSRKSQKQKSIQSEFSVTRQLHVANQRQIIRKREIHDKQIKNKNKLNQIEQSRNRKDVQIREIPLQRNNLLYQKERDTSLEFVQRKREINQERFDVIQKERKKDARITNQVRLRQRELFVSRQGDLTNQREMIRKCEIREKLFNAENMFNQEKLFREAVRTDQNQRMSRNLFQQTRDISQEQLDATESERREEILFQTLQRSRKNRRESTERIIYNNKKAYQNQHLSERIENLHTPIQTSQPSQKCESILHSRQIVVSRQNHLTSQRKITKKHDKRIDNENNLNNHKLFHNRDIVSMVKALYQHNQREKSSSLDVFEAQREVNQRLLDTIQRGQTKKMVYNVQEISRDFSERSNDGHVSFRASKFRKSDNAELLLRHREVSAQQMRSGERKLSQIKNIITDRAEKRFLREQPILMNLEKHLAFVTIKKSSIIIDLLYQIIFIGLISYIGFHNKMKWTKNNEKYLQWPFNMPGSKINIST